MTTTKRSLPISSAVKQRQQTMWASGDFYAVAALIQPVAEHLVRGRRPPGRLARPRRRHRQRQRRARRGAAAAATSSASTTSPRSSPGTPPGRGRRASTIDLLEGDAEAHPVPGCQLRRRPLDLRRRCSPPTTRRRSPSSARVVPPGRPDRARDLDARRVHRRDAEGRRRARAASAGRRIAAPLGHRGRTSARCSATRSSGLGCTRADVHVPLPLRGGLRRVLPRLLRADAEGVRGGRGRRSRRAVRGPRRPRRGRHAGTSEGPVAIPATWLETVATRSGRRSDLRAGGGRSTLATAKRQRWRSRRPGSAARSSVDMCRLSSSAGGVPAIAEGLACSCARATRSAPVPRRVLRRRHACSARCSRRTTGRRRGSRSRDRPGGRSPWRSWTPDGFIGQLFLTVAVHVTPPRRRSRRRSAGPDAGSLDDAVAGTRSCRSSGRDASERSATCPPGRAAHGVRRPVRSGVRAATPEGEASQRSTAHEARERERSRAGSRLLATGVAGSRVPGPDRDRVRPSAPSSAVDDEPRQRASTAPASTRSALGRGRSRCLRGPRRGRAGETRRTDR